MATDADFDGTDEAMMAALQGLSSHLACGTPPQPAQAARRRPVGCRRPASAGRLNGALRRDSGLSRRPQRGPPLESAAAYCTGPGTLTRL